MKNKIYKPIVTIAYCIVCGEPLLHVAKSANSGLKQESGLGLLPSVSETTRWSGAIIFFGSVARGRITPVGLPGSDGAAGDGRAHFLVAVDYEGAADDAEGSPECGFLRGPVEVAGRGAARWHVESVKVADVAVEGVHPAVVVAEGIVVRAGFLAVVLLLGDSVGVDGEAVVVVVVGQVHHPPLDQDVAERPQPVRELEHAERVCRDRVPKVLLHLAQAVPDLLLHPDDEPLAVVGPLRAEVVNALVFGQANAMTPHAYPGFVDLLLYPVSEPRAAVWPLPADVLGALVFGQANAMTRHAYPGDRKSVV